MTALDTNAYPARIGICPQTISVVVFALFIRMAVKGVNVTMINKTIKTWATEK